MRHKLLTIMSSYLFEAMLVSIDNLVHVILASEFRDNMSCKRRRFSHPCRYHAGSSSKDPWEELSVIGKPAFSLKISHPGWEFETATLSAPGFPYVVALNLFARRDCIFDLARTSQSCFESPVREAPSWFEIDGNEVSVGLVRWRVI